MKESNGVRNGRVNQDHIHMLISSHSDRELVLKLQKGNQNAFRQIFTRYQEKLLFYCITIVKSETIGEDLVQETFIRLWMKRGDLDPDRSISGFLHTIARNLALNHLKRAGYDKELKKEIWEHIQYTQNLIQIESDLFAREKRRLVQQAVDLLPRQRRIIFKLAREDRITHEEIANRLGISKNTVKNHMVLALKDIKAYLKYHSDIAFCWLITAGFWKLLSG